MDIPQQIDYLHEFRASVYADDYEKLGFVIGSLEALRDKDKRKKAIPNPLQQQFTDAYFVFYESRMKFKPKYGIADGKAIKDIMVYLQSITSDALVAWQMVLDNWHKLTPFIGNQVAPTQISRNLNEILSQLKFGSNKNEQRTNDKRDKARDVYDEINRRG
jgi:hypothetical protein